MTDINAWAAIDDNNNAVSPAGWPEGMMPSGVNNTARANMGALKRWRDQSQPTLTATGTANAQIITYPVAPAALAAGDVFSFYSVGTNTGAATLTVNAQAAKSIRDAQNAALTGGEMPAGALVMVAYDGTNLRLANTPSAAAIDAVLKTGDTMSGNLTTPGLTVSGTLAAVTANVSGTLTTATLTVTGSENISGNIVPATDGLQSNGNATHRWYDIRAVQLYGALFTASGISYPSYGLVTPAANIGFGYDYSNGFLWVVANGSSVGALVPNPSDARLKRNIGPLEVDALEALREVELHSYDRGGDEGAPGRHYRAGFIAQELRQVIPEAVIEPPPDVGGYLALDLLPLVAYCVGAIQQLAKRVNELETALVK